MNIIVPYFDDKHLFFSVFKQISTSSSWGSHSRSAEKVPAGHSIHNTSAHGVFVAKTKSSQDFTFLDLDEWMEGLER